MLGRVRYIIYSTKMIRLRDVTWRCHGPLHYNRKFQIFIFLIGHINVINGVFCLIISYLRIKSYNVLNYNNYSTSQYRVPRCSLEIFSKSLFFPSTIRLWNSLEPNFKSIQTTPKLKQTLKENFSQLNNCYNSIHCNFLFVLKHNQKGSMLGRVRFIIYSTNMIRLRDVTWRDFMAPYLRQEIPNIHISNWVY
jgi:hypothetical protein